MLKMLSNDKNNKCLEEVPNVTPYKMKMLIIKTKKKII